MRKIHWIIILSIAALVLITWMVWGNVTVEVTRYTVSSERIPASFEHFKIAVISDLHAAQFGDDNMELVNLIGEEKVDMIAITGDLCESKPGEYFKVEGFVKKLVKIAPCYYVTGNHEAKDPNKCDELVHALEKLGVNALRNEKAVLYKGSDAIALLGVDDPNYSSRYVNIQREAITAGLEEMNMTDDYSILLAHRPKFFDIYASYHVDLVLSGHIHGGQFRVPHLGGLLDPDRGLFPEYDAGMFTWNDTTMIVSRGLGTSSVPFRINNRPELVIVELSCDE